jgi:hypothetical protein
VSGVPSTTSRAGSPTPPKPPWDPSPRRRTIAAAIPQGSVRASGQARWIRAVEEHPDFASLRADALSNLLAIAWVLARSADWTSLTTRPTWPRVMRTTGIRRSTLAKDLRLLRDAGLLGVVETGSTPLFRPGVLHGLPRVGEGNRAAEYVLCVPCPPDSQDPRRSAVDETRTPSGFRQEASYAPPHARDNSPHQKPWIATVTPRTRGDMLAAARELQRRCPLLTRITAHHLRSLLRECWRAGWTPADVLHCLDHRPTGDLWPHTDQVRFAAGWVRFRISAWRAEDGSPLSSPSQQRDAVHQQVRADQVRRKAEWAAMRARAVAEADHAEHAAAARRLLRAQSPAAARVIDRSALAPIPVHHVAHPRRSAWL